MAIWYVRSDGGNSTQSNGTVDVAYPGSGTNTNSAWNNLNYAISQASLGDTIKIHAGHSIDCTYDDASLIGILDKGAGTDYLTITTTGTIPSFFTTDWPSTWRPGTASASHQYHRPTTAECVDMPKIRVDSSPASYGYPAIGFYNGAHHIKFLGVEITNFHSGTPGVGSTTVLINNSENPAVEADMPHHLIFDQCWIHPQECTGDIVNDSLDTSLQQAIFCSWRDFQITNTAITGMTGLGGASPERNSNSILATYCHHGLIENCLLEANGQVFFGGGGFWNQDHVGVSSSVSWSEVNEELTFILDNTQDVIAGDFVAIESTPLSDNHQTPLNYSDPAGGYVGLAGRYMNAEVLSVNTGTGQVVVGRPKVGWHYRGFRVYRYLATGGTYTLTWMGQTTSAISLVGGETERAAIQSALEALSNVAPGDVSVSGNGVPDPRGENGGYFYADYFVQFQGAWAYPTPVNPLTMTSSLTGGNGPPYGEVTGQFSESLQWVEVSEDGLLNDFPDVGEDVAWRGEICNNMTISKCIIAKRREWYTEGGFSSSKGFMEPKSCWNLTVNACVFTGQPTGIVGTLRNQGGVVPWALNNNITFSNCIWDECGSSMDWYGMDGTYLTGVSDDLLISNCLFLYPHGHPDLSTTPTASTHAVIFTAYTNLVMDHCTIFSPGQAFISYSSLIPDPDTGYPPVNPCLIKNCVIRPALSGITTPDSDITWTLGNWTMENNLFVNNLSISLTNFTEINSVINQWEESDPDTVFVSVSATPEEFYSGSTNFDATGDYQLLDSQYKAGGARDATDGKDLGFILSEFVTDAGFNPFTGEPAAGVVVTGRYRATRG